MGVILASETAKWAITLIVSIPITLILVYGLFLGDGTIWEHVVKHSLLGWTFNTFVVIAICGFLILITAVPVAWIVSNYQFAGRTLFEWTLILPLAIPGYVSAIAYADLLGVAGPIQSFIQNSFGLTAQEYWFPDIRSAAGCAFVLASNLFPYVYLTSRAAFIHQASDSIEASRTLGASQRRIFVRVALPSAIPGIVAGLSLALMETASDYGAANFLGVNTLTTGLVRTWQNFGDISVAARIACLLIFIAFFLRTTLNFGTRNRGREGNNSRWRSQTKIYTSNVSAVVFSLFCLTLLLWGFVLPAGRLLWVALESWEYIDHVGEAMKNTMLLATLGTIGTISVGFIVVFGSSMANRIASIASTAGYATPGAVLAIGTIIVVGSLKLPLYGFTAVLILVWVYVCRFSAVGIESIQASLKQAPDGLIDAARTLQVRPLRRILNVDLRIALPGILVGILVVFVEILKELPATLILRPFNWDTLAVKAYSYASDDRLEASALPCVLIIMAGLIPVSILCRQLSKSRLGNEV